MLDSDITVRVEEKVINKPDGDVKTEGTAICHKFETNLQADTLLPRMQKRAEPPGKILISLTTLYMLHGCKAC